MSVLIKKVTRMPHRLSRLGLKSYCAVHNAVFEAGPEWGAQPSATQLKNIACHPEIPYGAITGATWVRLPSGLWVLNFDGNDYVTIPLTLNTLLNGAAGITLITWFKASALPGVGVTNWIINIPIEGVTPLSGLSMALYNGDVIRIGGRSASTDTFRTTTIAFADTTTYHMAGGIFDFTNATINYYLDGVLGTPTSVVWGSTTYVNSNVTANSNLLGWIVNLSAGQAFNGRMILHMIFPSSFTKAQLDNIRTQERSWFGV